MYSFSFKFEMKKRGRGQKSSKFLVAVNLAEEEGNFDCGLKDIKAQIFYKFYDYFFLNSPNFIFQKF